MASLQGTTISSAVDPALTINTPASYDGVSLRLQSKAEPTAYYLYINSYVTSADVRWTFNQVNASTSYTNLISFQKGRFYA